MKKIRLDPEHLRVDSFATGADDAGGGTVDGHWSQPGTCDGRVATCQAGGTCGPDCYTRNCSGPYCL
ncbi:MAG TPA: hypothetical protein VHG08_24590 [Longimicrobium sp.]|nr:hypothetical protein [Longimicrobium sp.]